LEDNIKIGPKACFCEERDEVSGCYKGEEYLDELYNYKLLKEDSAIIEFPSLNLL